MTITSVHDGSSDKFYRAWADSADGSKGFSTTDSSKEYFGVYAGTKPPANYKAYSWTKIKGEAGRSVTNTEMEYAINDSKVTPPKSGWSLEMPVWKTGLYIWQRVKVSYSTGNPSYTTPHCLESNIIEDVTGNIGDWIFRDKTEVLSGTEIFTDKADADAVVHVEVDGKSYQHAGSGKNLLRNIKTTSFPPTYHIDVSKEIIENVETPTGWALRLKNIIINGVSPSIYVYPTNDTHYAEEFVGKPITISFLIRGSEPFKLGNTDIGTSWTKFTHHQSSWTSYNYHYGFDRNLDFVDISSIQIEHGSTPTEYEPPAPSPNYPIEIHSLNDFDMVSSVGLNNQFLNTDFKQGITHWSFTLSDGGISGNEGYTTAKSRYGGLQQSVPHYESLRGHVLYGRVDLKSDSVSSYFVFFNDGFNQTTRTISSSAVGKFTTLSATSTISNEAKHLYCRTQDSRTEGWTENRIKNLYVLDLTEIYGKGNEPTQAEMDALFKDKWAPSIFDITEDGSNHPSIDKVNLLLDEPLRSVGDVKDRLFRDTDGLWKIERNVGERILNGKEVWAPQSDGSYYTSFSDKKIDINTNLQSNRFMPVIGIDGVQQLGRMRNTTSNNNVVFYFDEGVGGAANFKSWLSSNNTKVHYELANPTIENLPEVLQDKLNNLRTFKDSNYVYTVLPDKSDILSENLKPTLHATFKSIAWANDFKYKFEQAKAMHSTDVWFAKGVSNTIAPNIGWSTDAPVWEDGLYIWSKTITTYGDGRTEESNPVCITGATGRSVDRIEEWYYLSNKPDVLEGGTWSKTPPTWKDGKYIWTKNKIIYKNPSGSEETSPINTTGGSGQKGDSGTDAKTVRLGNIIHAVHFDQDGLMPSVSSIAFPTAIQGFSGLTPYYEFKMGDTIVRGLSTASSWTLNTSSMKYSDFPVAVTVNVVINGQTIATDTATIVGTKPGEDAYTVVLANESHTFVGDVSNAKAGSTTANVIAYRGGKQVGATIGSITGLPVGMSSTIYSNGTTAARVTFTVTTSMTSPNGVVNIPVTVNGKSFTKVFNYAIAFKGAKGDKGTDGIAGKDGVGIKSTVLAYASSTSGTTTPSSGWQTTVPTVAAGNYLWTRTTWTYTDNSVENGYTVSRIGKDGNTGKDGIAGKDGVGIKSTAIHYAKSTSGTSHSGVTWATAIPSVPNGQYLWTRTTWTYDDNTTETGYSVAKMGETGATGPQGIQGPKGLDGNPTYTWIRYADTPTSGMSNSPVDKKYIGLAFNKATQTESSNYSDYQWSLMPQNIEIGAKTQDELENISHIYFNNNGYIEFPDEAKNLVHGGTEATIEFWNKQNSLSYGLLQLSGFADSNGVLYPYQNYTTVYLDVFRTNRLGAITMKKPVDRWHHFAVTTHPTEGWKLYQDGVLVYTASAQSTVNVSYLKFRIGNNSGNRYSNAGYRDIRLWNKARTHQEIITNMNQDVSESENGLVGYWKVNEGSGNTVVDLVNGNNGVIVNGSWRGIQNTIDETKEQVKKTVKTITEEYYQSTKSDSLAGGSWTTTAPKWDANKFMFVRSIITYVDGTTSYTPEINLSGAKGDKGDKGPQGVSITKVDVQYYLSTSNTSLTGGSWSTTAPAWIDGRFMWSKTVTTYTSGSPTESKPVCITGAKGSTGSTGSTGATGRGISSIVEQFYLSNSKTTQTGGSWSTTMPTWSPGKYVWTRSLITYTTGTPATSTTEPLVSSEWEAINEIEIGGRNLFTNSGNFQNTTNWSGVAIAYEGGVPYLTGSGTLTNSPIDIPLEPGVEYVFTAKLRFNIAFPITSVTPNHIYIRYPGESAFSALDGGISLISNETQTIAGQWHVISMRFKTKPDTSKIPGLKFHAYTNTTPSVKDILWVKLEKGNKPTDWSPTPEDVQSQINKSVKSTDVEYYLSTSSTSLSGGSWQTTAPAWVNGRFMWSRTKVTLNDGTTSYNPSSSGTNITGAKGSTGSTGASGKGVTSITEEYYLSTSKTTRVGGSWVTTAPTWSTGKYMWTRSKIVWNNPTSTTYSDPIVDNAWEAVNEIEVGGRNLLKQSNVRYQNTAYPVAIYKLTESILENSEVTLSIKGNLGRERFGIYNSGGMVDITTILPADKKDGVYKKTFKWKISSSNNTSIYVYPMPGGTGTASTIEWIKLEYGNKATDWSPAPEDLYQYVDDVEIGGRNLLPQSGNFTGTPTSFWVSNGGGLTYDSSSQFNGFGTIKTTVGNGITGQWLKLENGVDYTYSMTFKADKAFAGNNSVPLHYHAGKNNTNQGKITVFEHSTTYSASDVGSYKKIWIKFRLTSDADSWRPFIYGSSHDAAFNIANIQLEKGNKATDWTPAPEDVQSSIDEKADSSATEAALNEAASKLQVLQQEIEAAATSNELKDFIDKYNKDMASRDKDARESESSLSSALASISSIQTNMGDMSATWKFIDRFIKNTPQGIVVGNDSSGSYILIKEDRLSFYSNGQEVAFISQNLMEISRGAFVEQIQIAKYQFEESTTNHLTVRYVG